MLLQRENAVVEPFLQGQIVRKPAEENHGGMRMRIRKTGNQKISAAVDDAFRRKLLRLADIDDFAVRNVDFPL